MMESVICVSDVSENKNRISFQWPDRTDIHNAMGVVQTGIQFILLFILLFIILFIYVIYITYYVIYYIVYLY